MNTTNYNPGKHPQGEWIARKIDKESLTKQDETLEDAARDQFKNVRLGGEHPLNLYLLGNKFGASWQKEQDKVIIDGIFKKMAELKEEYDLMLQARDNVRKVSHDRGVIIDKLIEALGNMVILNDTADRNLTTEWKLKSESAKQLLQSLK